MPWIHETTYVRYLLTALTGFVGFLGIHAGCSSDGGGSGDGSGNFAEGGSFSSGATGGTSATGGSTSGGTAGTSATGGSTSGGSSGSSSSGASGGTSSGGSSGSTSSGGSSSTPDASLPDVTFTYDAPVIEEDACAAEPFTAEPIPVSIYIMLDRSCSMGSGSGSRLQQAKDAITAFVNDSSSDGLGVALDVFPSSSSNDCQTSDYRNPTVGMNNLPGNAGAIITALGPLTNTGGTPTAGALRGATEFCRDYQDATSTRCVPIIISDGFPESNDCSSGDNNASTLGNIAAAALSSWDVNTFTMGLSGLNTAGWNVLHTIADNGGTDCDGNSSNAEYACDASAGTQAFIDALNAIRDAVLSCDFNMPTPPDGVPDFDEVNVLFTPSGGGTTETFNRVNDAGSCSGDSWYYDDNNNPTQVSLCPTACDKVQADSTGEVVIELPCLGS